MREKTLETIQQMMQDPEVDPVLKERLIHIQSEDELEELITEWGGEEELDEDQVKRAQAVFTGIKAFFKEQGWRAVCDEERLIAVLGFRMRNATMKTYVAVNEDVESIRINTILPVQGIPECRLILGSFLNDLNLNLRYGGFHLDPKDGEVTFRYSYCYSDEGFNAEKFDTYLDACTIGPDRELKKILRIATGRLDEESRQEYIEAIQAFIASMEE